MTCLSCEVFAEAKLFELGRLRRGIGERPTGREPYRGEVRPNGHLHLGGKLLDPMLHMGHGWLFQRPKHRGRGSAVSLIRHPPLALCGPLASKSYGWDALAEPPSDHCGAGSSLRHTVPSEPGQACLRSLLQHPPSNSSHFILDEEASRRPRPCHFSGEPLLLHLGYTTHIKGHGSR